MKRKLESVTAVSIFKKAKNYESLSKQFVYTASLYQGKLQHTPSSGYYASGSMASPYANDFLLKFCDGIGAIPAQIKEAVAEKFKLMKESPANTNVVERERSDANLHMCCWDFCFLVLKDIGIVTEQQIDDLCYIVYIFNELNANMDGIARLSLADALLSPDGVYKDYFSGHLPSPGDVLIFKKIEPVLLDDSTEENPHYYSAFATNTEEQIGVESPPYHCSIAIDDQGGQIGLDDEDEYVRVKNFTTRKTFQKGCSFDDDVYSFEDDGMHLPEKVYYVPLQQVEQNISNFIAKHQNIIAMKDSTLKKSEKEVLNALIDNFTQYDTLATEVRDGPNFRLS